MILILLEMFRRLLSRLGRLSFVICLLATAAGCSGSVPEPAPTPSPVPGPDPGPGPGTPAAFSETETVRGAQAHTDKLTVDMPENALFVNKDVNEYLKSYDEQGGKIVFSKSEAVAKAAFKVGDVLYSGAVAGKAPDGYLLKITEVTDSSGEVVYTVIPAGLEDAFNELSFTCSLVYDELSGESVEVFDPFGQPDLSEALPGPDDGGTRAGGDVIDLVLDFTDKDVKLSKDKYSLEVDKTHAKLSIAIIDADGNYKTSWDQVKLDLTLSYDVTEENVYFKFDRATHQVTAEFSPRFGVSAGISYGLDCKLSPDEKENYKLEMEKKLLGKKIKIGSADIPIPATWKAVVSPRFDLYFTFNMKLSASLSAEAGVRQLGFNLHVENDAPYNYLKLRDGSSYFRFSKPEFYGEVQGDNAFSGSFGIGVGLVLKLCRIVDGLILDGRNKNFVGGFAEALFKVNGEVDIDRGIKEDTQMEYLRATVDGDYQFTTKVYIEGAVAFRGGDVFKYTKEFKDLARKFPESPVTFHKGPYEIILHHPVPYLLSPRDRAVLGDDDAKVELRWMLPEHDLNVLDDVSEFMGVTYDVYLSTDRRKVEESAPDARLEGIRQDGSVYYVTYRPAQSSQFFWKVVTHTGNGEGNDYESFIYSFDVGQYGYITFSDDGLRRYLADHPESIPGVVISENGTIANVYSNTKALRELTSLTINDPEGRYGIANIDDLLTHCPNLQHLDCNDNRITDIDLSRVPRLTALACGNNRLSTLDLKRVPDLMSLVCQNNPGIEIISLEGCRQLQTLSAAGCSLKSVSLGNPELVSLFLNSNAIVYLDITACPNLLNLYMEDQQSDGTTVVLTHAIRDRMAHFNYSERKTVLVYTDDIVHTSVPTDVTGTSAKVSVLLTEAEGLAIVRKGIVMKGGYDAPTVTDGVVTTSTDTANPFTVLAEGLYPGTHYCVRGFVEVSTPYQSKLIYGGAVGFWTVDPVETTPGEAVDLGLSVKWASTNVGASSPEGYGYYYAWGETERKEQYVWDDYLHCERSQTSLSKYTAADGLKVLEPGDDVAHVKWGEGWRLPTREEWQELVEKCDWSEMTERGGVKGRYVYRKGDPSAYIFLPAAGNVSNSVYSYVGETGYYWSSRVSVLDYRNAYYCLFNSTAYGWDYSLSRAYGRSVRPVMSSSTSGGLDDIPGEDL